MSLRPLHRRVLLKLDPERRTLGAGLFVAPDTDTMTFCRKCHRQQEALKGRPCVAEPEYRRVGDTYELVGQNTAHEIESVTIPVVVESARRATVVASGTPGFEIGERVLIDFASGVSAEEDDPDSPYRIVVADAILAHIEEAPPSGNGHGG